MKSHKSIVKSAMVLVSLLAIAACDVVDQAQIAETDARLMQAMDDRDGEVAADLLTHGSLEAYDTRLWYALYGNEAEINALAPVDLWEVIMMRCRCSAEELQGMSGRDWVVHAINQGWYADESWAPVSLHNISVDVDYARAEIYIGGLRTGDYLLFYKEDGVWKEDFNCLDASISEWIKQDALASSKSVRRYLLEEEELFKGERISPGILKKPMLQRPD